MFSLRSFSSAIQTHFHRLKRQKHSPYDFAEQPDGLDIENEFEDTEAAWLSPDVRCNGWILFFQKNTDIPIAGICGWLCCLSVIVFTGFVAPELLECPDFAVDCHISTWAATVRDNLGNIQGGATAVYTIGLSAMAYAACGIAESLLWPLLTKQALTIAELEIVLSSLRGSIPAAPFSFFCSYKNRFALFTLVTVVVITLTPITAGPLIGYTYERQNVTHEFEGHYQVGGGIARLYAQKNPPTSVFGEALSLYISWSTEVAPEPLPELRECLVDRSVLAGRGNTTFYAVTAKTNVSCQGVVPDQLDSDEVSVIAFGTNMAPHNRYGRPKNSSDRVEVRSYPQLAVWSQDFAFIDEYTTESTLVLAALNGTIEGGIETEISSNEYIKWISAVSCEVSVRLEDGEFRIGEGSSSSSAPAVLSSLAGLRVRRANSSDDDGQLPYNENGLWLANAPNLVGVSVDGRQGMFQSQLGRTKSGLPITYTSSDENDNSWELAEIENFIRVSVGAVALASARSFTEDHPEQVVLKSAVFTRKLDTWRALYLIIPPFVIAAGSIFLMLLSHKLHQEEQLPIMRKASVSEILKSAQTEWLLEKAAKESYENRPSTLGQYRVMFGMAPGPRPDSHPIAGLGYKVMPFREFDSSSHSMRME